MGLRILESLHILKSSPPLNETASNFKILNSCNSQMGLRILESLHILKSSPPLNETNSCFPLHIAQ